MAGFPLSRGEGRLRASFRSRTLASWAYSSSRWTRQSSSENVIKGWTSSWALRAIGNSPEPLWHRPAADLLTPELDAFASSAS
jgi:hypothetical protein